MANHAHAKLLGAVDDRLLKLLAVQALGAAFGDYYVAQDELFFTQRVGADGREGTARSGVAVWTEGPRHVEMSHSSCGLDAVAQNIAFQALSAGFGALMYWDDGWRSTPTPGRQPLNSMRRFHGGFGERDIDDKGCVTVSMWLLSGRQERAARKACDPKLFERRGDTHASPAAQGDVLDWGRKIDWAGAVESLCPAGAGLSAAMARAALLPSAALGLPCHGPSLAKAGRSGLEKALALALFWGRSNAALEVFGAIKTTSPDPAASLMAAKALRDKWAAARAKVYPGAVEDRAAQAAFEAVELDAQTPAAASPRPRSGL